MSDELPEMFRKGQFIEIIEKLEDRPTYSGIELYYLLESYYNLGAFTQGMSVADMHIDSITRESSEYIETMYTAGAIYAVGVEFRKSIRCYELGLEKARERSDVKSIANGLMDLGNTYADQGELETAREHIEKSLILFRDSNDFLGEAYARANLGYIKKDMGRFKEALLDLEEAENYIKKEPNKVHTAILTKNIIEVLVELEFIEEARNKLDEIARIQSTFPNPRVDFLFMFAEALINKSSPRMRDKVKAIDQFAHIIKQEEYTPNRLLAIRHICDLLLQEYKIFENKKVLEEVQSYIGKMQEIAKEKKVFPYLISSLILQAKLSIIQNKYDVAEKLFVSASTIAREKNLGYYTILAERESTKLKESLVEMKNLVDGYSQILEEQTMDDIFDYLKLLRGKL